MPQLNLSAADAAHRTSHIAHRRSPIDDGNLNRSFPGDPPSGPTAQIADYFYAELQAGAPVSVDLHSGDSSLEHLP